MDDQKAAAQRLRQTYAEDMAKHGGDLEVTGRKRLLSAAVTWRESNVYDHIDIDLVDTTIEQASALVEAQIQRWIEEGPPPA